MDIANIVDKSATIWYCPTYDIKEDTFLFNKGSDEFNKGFFCFFPSIHETNNSKEKNSITIVTGAEYKDAKYWLKNKKENLADKLVGVAENIIPNLSQKIEYKEIATPLTLNEYSLNYNGAVHGWESTILQLGDPFITYRTFVDGLYLTGHWVMQKMGQGGILTSANVGKLVARKISKDILRKKRI